MSDYLTKEEIFSMDDLPVEDMIIPEWKKKKIKVRGATAAERDDYEQSLINTRVEEDKTVTQANFANAKARFVVKCVLKEDGTRMFSDGEANKLGDRVSGVINRIFNKIQDLSGMSKTSAKDIEKNSGAAQIDDSQ